jgi:hypothetical protein
MGTRLDQMELDPAVLFRGHDLPRSRLSSRRSRADGLPSRDALNAATLSALPPTSDANPDLPRSRGTAVALYLNRGFHVVRALSGI